MANTVIYKEDWEANLQANLTEATLWKEVARVDFTDTYTLHNPYKNRAAVSSYTKGAQYSFSDVTVTDESVSLSTVRIIPEFIDEADLGIAGYNFQMELSDDQARAINEAIETHFLDEATSQGTTFDDGSIGGSGGASIDLTNTNVDDVVRGARRELMEGRGFEMYNRNGATFVWRPADFEKLAAYAMGQGFGFADSALATGRVIEFGGFTHRESNLLNVESSVAHSLAMVNKAVHIGVYNGTYGKVKVNDQDPNLQSGVGIVSRVDMGVKVWNNMTPLVLDVQITE
jgi:hypothetical protein